MLIMKKLIKNNIKVIVSIIVTAIVVGSITGVVAYNYSAKNIAYIPNDPSWNVNNVGDALKDLYNYSDKSKGMILETGSYTALSQGNDSVKQYTIPLKNTYTEDQNAYFIVTNVYNATYPNNWYGRFNSTKEKVVGNSFSIGICNYSGSWQTASISYMVVSIDEA